MITAILPTQVQAARIKICHDCKFYVEKTNSCGTFILARLTDGQKEVTLSKIKDNVVTYYKKKIRLCGCKISEKVKYAWAQCPAGKWPMERVTIEDMERLREVAKEIEAVGSIHTADARMIELYTLLSKLTGQNIQRTSCSSCIRDLINFALNSTKEFE